MVLLLLYPAISGAQIAFDKNFENGRLDTAYLHNQSFKLWPITNLHCRLTNARDQQPAFKIFDSLGYQLRSYHHMVYRYEGENNWRFFDTAYKLTALNYYHFYNFSPFIKDTVYLAYWFPYTYSDLQKYIAGLSGNKYLLKAGVKGSSYQGRNIYGYQITDTAYAACYKSNVVITARQHPTENINGYFIEGLTDYLLYSTDAKAAYLRRNFHFFIYPMLNPDGVFNGSGENALGQGLNREWEDSLKLSGTPEIDTIRPVIWTETGKKVNWAIDIHSNAGSNLPYYWWGYINGSPVPSWQIQKASVFVQSVYAADSSSMLNTSLYQNNIQGNGANASLTAANWFRRSFAAIAYTFEPTSEPMGPLGNNALPVSKLKKAGESLAKGFYNVFDTVQAMGVTIDTSGNKFTATVSGGHKPYRYNWTGPVTGNSDTLLNLLTGLYNLTVTDSAGCTWQKTISYTSSGSPQPNNSSNGITIYPNPSNGALNLTSIRPLTEVRAEVYDLTGRIISVQSISIDPRTTLILPPTMAGTYWLKLSTSDLVLVKKIVVIR